MQIALWEDRNKKPATTLAKRLMESKAIYKINKNDTSGMAVLLTSILGNIPDETMMYLLSKKLSEIMEMTREELLQLKGITPKLASRLIAVFEIHRMIQKEKQENKVTIQTPNDIATLMDEIRYLDREQFRAVLLDTKNQVITIETITIGILDSSLVHPREVFKSAIKRSAARIVLVHNHPSGDPTPSKEDINITKRLIEVGKIIGINILDHLIIGDGRFTSLKSEGLM
ncbi:DNA repair protein RadC [Desulfohalotomaculum tongense]|nr:DNA repair protein RadC [Desulforadius tongensis]